MFKIKIKGGHTIYGITSFTADEYKFKLIYKGSEAQGDLSLNIIESIEKQEIKTDEINIYPKDIRIGNYIFYNDLFYSIEGVNHNCVTVEEGVIDIDYIYPIRLNDEWLIKLNCPKTFLSQDESGFFVWFNREKIYLTYVHELQNLYYSLKGNELIIEK